MKMAYATLLIPRGDNLLGFGGHKTLLFGGEPIQITMQRAVVARHGIQDPITLLRSKTSHCHKRGSRCYSRFLTVPESKGQCRHANAGAWGVLRWCLSKAMGLQAPRVLLGGTGFKGGRQDWASASNASPVKR